MGLDASRSRIQDAYAIASGQEGKRRLDLLAEIMRPTTFRLLQQVGVSRGDHCLDVGCGGGHVTVDLAELIGPEGRVIGVDFDPEIVELARQGARAAGVDNVQFQVGDARTFEGGPFDVVYARFLLSHVERSWEVLAHLRGLIASGGTLVVEDVDFSGCYCYPGDPAYNRFLQLYGEVVGAAGGDANIGRRLPVLLSETGLRDVAWNVFQPVHADGPPKLIQTVTMERIAPAVLRLGLASADEIDAILHGMRSFAADLGTLVAMPRMVQAWGGL